MKKPERRPSPPWHGKPGDVNDYLKDDYHVLYRIAKKHGDIAAALAYYERYVAQDKRYAQ